MLVDRLSGDGTLSSVRSTTSPVAGSRAEHVLSSGRRRVAFVGGPLEIRQVSDRHEGARQAVDAVAGSALEVLETAVRTLMEEAADSELEPRQVVFQPELVVRESTRNDPATRRN